MKIDITENYIRARKMDPKLCHRESFRNTPIKGGKGKRKITCCLKPFWDKKTGQCRVGADAKSRMRLQSVLTPRKKGKKAKK